MAKLYIYKLWNAASVQRSLGTFKKVYVAFENLLVQISAKVEPEIETENRLTN